MKNALLLLFLFFHAQSLLVYIYIYIYIYIFEMLGFRKLSEEHAKWRENTVLSDLFAFSIKITTLS